MCIQHQILLGLIPLGKSNSSLFLLLELQKELFLLLELHIPPPHFLLERGWTYIFNGGWNGTPQATEEIAIKPVKTVCASMFDCVVVYVCVCVQDNISF